VIDIIIADNHPIVREGLKRIVEKLPDMRVVDEALTKSSARDVDVLLLDVSMPGSSFLHTLARLRAELPAVRVLVLSVHAEEHYAVRALKAGAHGYLTKDHTPEELAGAIRQVSQGGSFVSPALAGRLASEIGGDPSRPRHEKLTDREYQVFWRLGSGKRIKDISTELALSPKTVSTYRARILEKMGLGSTAELIRYAVERELYR